MDKADGETVMGCEGCIAPDGGGILLLAAALLCLAIAAVFALVIWGAIRLRRKYLINKGD